jgi:hypothetical protein
MASSLQNINFLSAISDKFSLFKQSLLEKRSDHFVRVHKIKYEEGDYEILQLLILMMFVKVHI